MDIYIIVSARFYRKYYRKMPRAILTALGYKWLLVEPCAN